MTFHPAIKRLLPLLLLAAFFAPLRLRASENEIVIKPGETIYARFHQKGVKLKLLNTSLQKDDQAQVIATLTEDERSHTCRLKIENGFDQYLDCEAAAWSGIFQRHFTMPVSPVVGGKVTYVEFPPYSTQITLSEFKLEK